PSYEADKDIAGRSNPSIRHYTVPKLKADHATNNVSGSWQVCEPSTSPNFSAVAYYFARDLQKALGVPVGVIHTSWGGSPAEVWIREDIMARDKEYARDILEKYPPQKLNFEKALAQWEKERDEAKENNQAF